MDIIKRSLIIWSLYHHTFSFKRYRIKGIHNVHRELMGKKNYIEASVCACWIEIKLSIWNVQLKQNKPACLFCSCGILLCASGEVKEKLYVTRCPFKSLILRFLCGWQKRTESSFIMPRWHRLIYRVTL